MRSILLFPFLLLVSVALLAGCAPADAQTDRPDLPAADSARQFYLLRTYTFANAAQQELTDEYLEGTYLPALKAVVDQPIGVFHQKLGEEDSVRRTYVLVPFADLRRLADLDTVGLAGANPDGSYLSAAFDAPPYLRFETTVLRAFAEMPQLTTPSFATERAERVYELRSYESSNETFYRTKLDMFNAGGEVALFDRLGFNAVFYGEVLAGPAMPNLMYLTTFPTRAVRDSLWEAFGDAPEWEALTANPKYDNSVSEATIYFLEPTAYSAY